MPSSDMATLLQLAGQLGLADTSQLQLAAQLAESQRSSHDEEEEEKRRRRAQRRRRAEQAALDFLRLKNAELAAACGACVCWGERPGCEFCGGAGAPGWRMPDETYFERYLRPVMERRTVPSRAEARAS